MENAIKEAFNVIIEKRVEGETFAKFKQTSKYVETEGRIHKAFENLKESFTSAQQLKLLLELEEAWNNQKALYLEYAYRQGLEDSLVFQKMLKKYEYLSKEQ